MELTGEEKERQLKAYLELLKHPSISATGEGIRETSQLLRELMESLGVSSSIVETAGHPVVYGEYSVGGSSTLLIYNHYDVQPVDPLEEWTSDPFSAEVRGGRVYARGASDNKGTLVARLFGSVKAVREGKVNLKFLYEGEEEIGSPNLSSFVEANSGKLKANGVLMEGSSLDHRGRPLIVLGVKGLLYVQLDISTGERDLHSSNAPIVYNPAWEMISVLSTLVEDGKVKIPGFYDKVRPLNEREREMLKDYDVSPEELMGSLRVERLRFDDPQRLREALFGEPTCTIDGIVSGYIGKGSKTVVPHKASVKMDFRLVPDQDPKEVLQLLRAHLNRVGFKGTLTEMGLERPMRTSPDTRLVRALEESAREVYGKNPVLVPNSAGTQPMGLFVELLGVKEVASAIGVGDPNSNAHAPNESIELDNFFKAVEHTSSFIKWYSSNVY
jgi:Acetylornithine deacetylase/Succinyl-diaminopimelate desuccinylase and related deacylases